MNHLNNFFVVILGAFFIQKLAAGVELGKLSCTENGIYPDDKLIGIVMQKCQPKLDDTRDILIACVTKCIMKQIKALKKNGKPKKTEAKKLATILPDEYQEEGKTVFDDCYKKYQGKVKKESKCDSWVPFSKCFIGFAENICRGNSTTTTPASEGS